MMDMGVEPYLLFLALAAVVAQRLVARRMPACRPPICAAGTGGKSMARWGRLDKRPRLFACYDSGYRGRLGIHEILNPATACNG